MNDTYLCDSTGCSDQECACWNNFCKVCAFEADGGDCPKCDTIGDTRQGINHVYLAENVSDDAYVLGLYFDELPFEFGPERTEWHTRGITAIQEKTGVYLLDLLGDGDPDYSTVSKRLNDRGFDTYDSDTTFEVYHGLVRCGPDCDNECHK